MTTSLTEKVEQVRQHTAKGLALYASAKATLNTAKILADQVCHKWSIEPSYAEGMYDAAMKLAADHVKPLPGVRTHARTGETHRQQPFASKDWAWVPIPGISLAIQARTGYGNIEFRAPRLKDIEALKKRVEELEEQIEEDEHDIDLDFGPVHRTEIYSWGDEGWEYRKWRNSRSFESVVLPRETQAEIESELKRFTECRERMLRLEMPWRRGFLLSGPPGTGKTSLSLAIAGVLRFNLATLSLTDIKSDGMLRKAVSKLPAHTVLVIEDIDAYSVSNERDHNTAKDGDLSLSGLLNSLDGFETPEGMVTILTTNHIEKLDPALIRSGRMDRTFHLGHIDGPELERLFTWFYELAPLEPAPENTLAAELSPADVAELFKQNLDDAVAGWMAVRDRIESVTHKNLEVVA